MLHTITGTDERGTPATVTVDITEPNRPALTVPPMLAGVTVDPGHLERLLDYPDARLCRVFWGPGTGFPAWTDRRMAWLRANAPKVIPHVSFKDWADEAAARKGVTAFLDGLTAPAGTSTDPLALLTWMHEAEPKNIDPALYRRNWWSLAGIVGDHPNGALVDLIPIQTLQWTQDTKASKGRGDLSKYYIGVGHPGIDSYANSWDKTYPDPKQFLTLPLQLADRAGTAPCLPELGAARLATDTTGQGRADWIRAVAALLRSEGCRYVSWWDDLGTGGTDFRLDDEPSKQAWQDVTAGRI